VDALSGLLDGPRARGAFLLRTIMTPPWSVRIQDRAPLSLVAMVRDGAWVLPNGGAPVRLRPGDVAVLRGPEPYTFADDPATRPQVVIQPGERCTTPDGEDMHGAMDLGVRTWGNDPDGSAVLLVGTYQMRGEVSHRLLRALPGLLVGAWHQPAAAPGRRFRIAPRVTRAGGPAARRRGRDGPSWTVPRARRRGRWSG
jgi:hypothetical protein